jgi:hypothetical protein
MNVSVDRINIVEKLPGRHNVKKYLIGCAASEPIHSYQFARTLVTLMNVPSLNCATRMLVKLRLLNDSHLSTSLLSEPFACLRRCYA